MVSTKLGHSTGVLCKTSIFQRQESISNCRAANVEIRICCPSTSNLARCPKRGSQEFAGSTIWRADVTVWISCGDAASMSSQKKLSVERAVHELAALDLKN